MYTPIELTRQEELAQTFSDFYKEINGFRPRWMNLNDMTVEQLEAAIDGLQEEGKVQADMEAVQEAAAVVKFEALVQTTIASGAADRETAVRWIADAEGVPGDWEFLCFKSGLPYGYFNKK